MPDRQAIETANESGVDEDLAKLLPPDVKQDIVIYGTRSEKKERAEKREQRDN